MCGEGVPTPTGFLLSQVPAFSKYGSLLLMGSYLIRQLAFMKGILVG